MQDSTYAELVGDPVALLGLLAYVTVLGLVAWDSSSPARWRRRSRSRAVGFAVYLIALQAFVIDAWCIWCLVNDLVVVPLLAVLTVWRVREVGPTRSGGAGLRHRHLA